MAAQASSAQPSTPVPPSTPASAMTAAQPVMAAQTSAPVQSVPHVQPIAQAASAARTAGPSQPAPIPRAAQTAHSAQTVPSPPARETLQEPAEPTAPPRPTLSARRTTSAPARTAPATRPEHKTRARWSRRQGVVTVFAGFAVVAFGVAYIGPLGASLATRASAETNPPPATIYSLTQADAQSLNTDHATAQSSLQRDKYTVKVIPQTAPAQSSDSSSLAARVTSTFVAPSPGTAQAIAYKLVTAHGWNESQFQCLVALWNRESGWRVNAANPSGAYGIPQALPGSKMAAYGSDWATNPETQIKWGLSYIVGSYGTPCGAWGHSNAYGWY